MKKFLSIILALVILFTISACSKTSVDELEIEFYHQIGTDVEKNKQLFDQIIEDFENENPGIKVKHVCLPVEETWTVLSTRIQNNDTPDVFNGWFDTEEFKLMDSGVVADLTGSKLCDYVASDVLEKHTLNGKNYILPMTLNFVGVYYNVNIFNENNISIPTTMDEFWAVCEKLEALGITPISAGDKDAWNLGYTSQVFMGYLMPNCVSEFDSIFKEEMHVSEMVGIADFADAMIKRGKYTQSGAMGADADAMLSNFVNQNAAMMIEGANWLATLNSADLDFEYSIFPFPGKNAEDTQIMINADISLMISSSCSEEKRIAAEKFVEFLLTKGAKYYIEQTDCPSALKGIKASGEHYKLVQTLLDNSQTFSRPIAGHWTDASFMEYQVALQSLLVSKDKDAFYEEVEQSLLTHGKPPIYLN